MGLSLRPRTNSKSLYSVLLPETKKCLTLVHSNSEQIITEEDQEEWGIWSFGERWWVRRNEERRTEEREGKWDKKQKVTVLLIRQYIFRDLYTELYHLDLNLLALQLWRLGINGSYTANSAMLCQHSCTTHGHRHYILNDFPYTNWSADAVYCHILTFTPVVRLQEVRKTTRIAF
jgi:hypothetical protein